MCLPSSKVPPSPKTPTPEDAVAAGNRELMKRAGAKGFSSTILGGALPQTPNATPAKTLLG